MKSYVEHANMSVVDAQKTIHFLTSAIPERRETSWRRQGQFSCKRLITLC